MSSSNIIYSADPGLILAFHGCDESTCQAIISGREMLKTSKNKYDWLGSGIYFWQNNYDRALHFATHGPSNKGKVAKPAVIGAVLSLGNCLDLTDKKNIDLVKVAYNTFKETTELTGNKLPENTNPITDPHSPDKVLRELDCKVIEYLHSIVGKNEPFDSVRGVFFEGSPVYNGAGFFEKTHIQICIRNPNCIKGFFLPRKRVKWPTSL
ncbi:hypothetical protein ECE50_026340 [Chitinophaga sp. Mgbs1]|uniref:Uncharacterized protein n=1 Tax=Chitinophaga solisilvae TaxID=1233460 RepID=A0A9Q5D976_9BACT|nr:hypothetical protein [Chitinophaga solisilvae]